MKKLISILGLFALTSLSGYAQSTYTTGPSVPNTTAQFTYVDPTGHSVPYGITYPITGQVQAVFDPSTSAIDISHAYNDSLKAKGIGGVAPSGYFIASGYVNTSINVGESRVGVPFVVNNTNTGSTLATIPFNYPTVLQTNGHYRFEARLYINAGTGGTKIDVGGTCNTSNFVAAYKAYSTTSILYGGQLTSFLSGPSGSSTTGTTFIEIVGELDVTNSGTFVIQFAQNAANGTSSTVLAGSTLTVIQIP